MIKSFITGFTCFGASFPMVVNHEYLLALVILIGGIVMFSLTLVTLLIKEENNLAKDQASSQSFNRSVEFLITEKYRSGLSSRDLNKVTSILQTTDSKYIYN